MNIKLTVFWNVTTFPSTDRHKYFTEKQCLHLPSCLDMEAPGFSTISVPAQCTSWRHIRKDCSLTPFSAAVREHATGLSYLLCAKDVLMLTSATATVF